MKATDEVENPVVSLHAKKTPEFENPAPAPAPQSTLRAADESIDGPVNSPALRLQQQLRAAIALEEPVVERYPLIWSLTGVVAFCSAFWALVAIMVF